MTTRRRFMMTAALMAAAVQMASMSHQARAEEDKAQLMFVQTAEDLKADGKSLRLVNVGQQTVCFSDRPVRIAGHMTMPAFMDEWKAGEGPDNFGADPPNATLSVYEPGRPDNTLTVVESVILSLTGKTWSTTTS
jgi:hypothetical protein